MSIPRPVFRGAARATGSVVTKRAETQTQHSSWAVEPKPEAKHKESMRCDAKNCEARQGLRAAHRGWFCQRHLGQLRRIRRAMCTARDAKTLLHLRLSERMLRRKSDWGHDIDILRLQQLVIRGEGDTKEWHPAYYSRRAVCTRGAPGFIIV